MLFDLFFLLSLGVLLASLLTAALGSSLFRKSERNFSLYHLFVVSTLLAGTLFFYPISFCELGSSVAAQDILAGALASLYNTIRLFAIDGDYFGVLASVAAYAPESLAAYRVLGVVLHLLAPILTFGFILSFVKNFSAGCRYFFSPFKEAHIFSELNERSLSLAKSIIAKDKERHPLFPRVVVVFTDVIDKKEEAQYDLLTESERRGAILFRKDLEGIRFRMRISRRPLNFYLFGEDEREKLRHAISVRRDYDYGGAALYYFSKSAESEHLVSARNEATLTRRRERNPLDTIRVVRVNDIQSLIYHNLDKNGTRLFYHARERGDNTINSVIVGLGSYGTEMLKALCWYGQVPGFSLKITAFERDDKAEEHFRQKCPELMEKNGNTEEGEAHYQLKICGGIDVNTADFYKKLDEVGMPTHIFISLGNDEVNIAAAVAIRSYLEGKNTPYRPDIETVVYEPEVARTMGMRLQENPRDEQDEARIGGASKRGVGYRIHMIGDLDGFYSIDTLLDSALSMAGLRVHLRYSAAEEEIAIIDTAEKYAEKEEAASRRGLSLRSLYRDETKEEHEARCQNKAAMRELEKRYGASYFMVEYNYRSSITKALHERLRRKLKAMGYLEIPGVDKPWGERTEEEKLAIGLVEHVRWNAYMRTEGYCHAEVRLEIAKQHPLLRSTKTLTEADLRKDA